NLSRLADVGIDAIGCGVVYRPARAARERYRCDHDLIANRHDRCRAVLTDWFAEVKREQVTPARVVGDAVRTRSDIDAADERFVIRVEYADASAAAVRCHEELLFLVDQYARDAWKVLDRTQVRVGRAVDDV